MGSRCCSPLNQGHPWVLGGLTRKPRHSDQLLLPDLLQLQDLLQRLRDLGAHGWVIWLRGGCGVWSGDPSIWETPNPHPENPGGPPPTWRTQMSRKHPPATACGTPLPTEPGCPGKPHPQRTWEPPPPKNPGAWETPAPKEPRCPGDPRPQRTQETPPPPSPTSRLSSPGGGGGPRGRGAPIGTPDMGAPMGVLPAG